MITVDQLFKNYGDYTAVSGVSFSASAGDVVGILGPNGAGKTSTLRMLSTYLCPTAGSASIAGFDILTQADEVRRRIGYLPENPPLYNEFTVHEFLRFVAEIKDVPRREIEQKIAETVERCFLEDVVHRPCGHLSKGYRQRVGLAQAMIHNPDVLILDEPTSGLDPRQIVDIRKLIRDLSINKTVLISTHILPEVSMVCSKVVILAAGKVVLESGLAALEAESSLEEAFLRCINGDAEEAG